MRRDLKDEDALAEAMVDAYGLDGFLQAVDAIRLRKSADYQGFAYCLFDLARERFGEEKVATALRERAKLSTGTREFIRALRRDRQWRASLELKRREPTLRQVLQGIERGRTLSRGDLYRFSRQADRLDIQFLFNRMLKETRPAFVHRYLQFFFDRELPSLDERIFEWARTGDADVHWAAMLALSNVKHKTVRNFALERLSPKDGPPDWWALRLLRRNCRKGDGRWILPRLPPEGDANVLHDIGLNLTGIDVDRDETLVRCLLWVYEKTPCSMCRGRATRSLIYLRRAPQWLLREAVHDADESSREDAKWALSGRGKGKVTRRRTAGK
jgi:hypothetical protein